MSYFKTKNIWFWGFLILLVLNISVVGSMMYHGHKMRKEHPDFRVREGTARKSMETFVTRRLDLNEAQREKVKALHKDNKKDMSRLMRSIKDKELELFTLYSSGGDSTSLALCVEELNTLNTQRSMNILYMYSDMKEICTPEQHPKLDEMFTDLIVWRTNGLSRGPGKHDRHPRQMRKQRRN